MKSTNLGTHIDALDALDLAQLVALLSHRDCEFAATGSETLAGVVKALAQITANSRIRKAHAELAPTDITQLEASLAALMDNESDVFLGCMATLSAAFRSQGSPGGTVALTQDTERRKVDR